MSDPIRAALAEQQGEGLDDIPPAPFSERELREQWNQQAEEFNQWDSLDSYEQLAWAQARAIQRDRNARPTPPAEGEVAAISNAIDAMKLALNSHNVSLPSDPPQDAWKFRCVSMRLADAISQLEKLKELINE